MSSGTPEPPVPFSRGARSGYHPGEAVVALRTLRALTDRLAALAEQERPETSVVNDATATNVAVDAPLAELRAACEELAEISARLEVSLAGYEAAIAQLRTVLASAQDDTTLLRLELRIPLTVVRGRAQLLQRRIQRAEVPDVGLLAGLTAIDAAVERIVARLSDARQPRTGPSVGGRKPGSS